MKCVSKVSFLLAMGCFSSMLLTAAQETESAKDRIRFAALGQPLPEIDKQQQMFQDAVVSLERVSLPRIKAARDGYKKKLDRLRLGVRVAAGTGVAAIIASTVWGAVKKQQQNADALKEGREHSIDALKSDTTLREAAKITQQESRNRIEYEQLLLTREMNSFWGRTRHYFTQGSMLALGGLIAAGATPLFKFLYGSSEEAIRLWWNGYDYWYQQLNVRLKDTMHELRDSLYQARKVQGGYEVNHQLRVTREGEVATYYRSDITNMYQVSLGIFERIVALMYHIAPADKHELIATNTEKIIRMIDRFACHLETDLNINTHGFITHYSGKTLDSLHQLFDGVMSFLTFFEVHLRS